MQVFIHLPKSHLIFYPGRIPDPLLQVE